MNRNKKSQSAARKQTPAKGKQAKKKQSQGARNGVTAPYIPSVLRRVRPNLFGSPGFSSNTASIPAAFVNVENDPTYMKMVGPCKNKRLDLIGTCLVGRQPLTDVATAAATLALFTTGTLATAGTNSITVSPDTFNGPLAAQANLHQLYVFRDILISYESNVATTQAGSCSLAYSRDGAGTGGAGPPTSFSEARQISPTVNFPFRADRAYLHIHYDGDEVWYTESNANSVADLRMTNQGCIYGFPSITSLGAISQGFLDVQYVIELYQPCNSQGFTAVTPLERKLVRDLLARHRAEQEECKEIDQACASSSTAPPSVRVMKNNRFF